MYYLISHFPRTETHFPRWSLSQAGILSANCTPKSSPLQGLGVGGKFGVCHLRKAFTVKVFFIFYNSRKYSLFNVLLVMCTYCIERARWDFCKRKKSVFWNTLGLGCWQLKTFGCQLMVQSIVHAMPFQVFFLFLMKYSRLQCCISFWCSLSVKS